MNPQGLLPHQQTHAAELRKFLTANGAALDASDTGVGKTFIALWVARELGVVPLVICPKSVRVDWEKAAAIIGVEIEVVNYERVRGARRRGKLAMSEWGKEVAVGKGSKWVWHEPYTLIIFDEVDRCGAMVGLNSKLLIAARRQCPYILALSATAADDPRQLKALGYALRLFDTSQYKWWLLAHGCVPGIFGGFVFPRDSPKAKIAMQKIHQKIFGEGRRVRLRREDIPGFPRTLLDIKLIHDDSGKAQGHCLDLEAAYREGQVLAAIIEARQALELLKVPYLLEMAEHYAQTSRVVVFVNYSATILALQEGFKALFETPAPSIDGSNTQDEREEIKRAFQAGELPALVCNVAAGGLGIGLHDPQGIAECTTLISPCYSSRQIRQVHGRVQRQGGAFSRQYLVYFADTLEEQIAAAVKSKLANLDTLNDGILNGVLK